MIPSVQMVQVVQAPSFILPRATGEECMPWTASKRGEGLNGAQRLNVLNDLNG